MIESQQRFNNAQLFHEQSKRQLQKINQISRFFFTDVLQLTVVHSKCFVQLRLNCVVKNTLQFEHLNERYGDRYHTVQSKLILKSFFKKIHIKREHA